MTPNNEDVISLANECGIDVDMDGDIMGSTNGALFVFVSRLLSRPAEAQPVLRVCPVSDIECSHGCGTGQCKKEAQPVARVPVEGLSRHSHAMFLNVLWHHQGGSSSAGQAIRAMLGIGQHDHLTDEQVAEAKWIDGLLAQAPEGRKLVPIEPTAEMLIAGSVSIGMDPLPAGGEDGYAITGEQSTMRKCYEAMLAAAASQAPAVSEGAFAPVDSKALAESIAEVEALSFAEDRGLTNSETESMMLVLRELRRLSALAIQPVASTHTALAEGGEAVALDDAALDRLAEEIMKGMRAIATWEARKLFAVRVMREHFAAARDAQAGKEGV